jgi:hypothetical protein
MNKEKECLTKLVEELTKYYIEDIGGVPYEIIISFQAAAELVGNKKAIKFMKNWDECD